MVSMEGRCFLINMYLKARSTIESCQQEHAELPMRRLLLQLLTVLILPNMKCTEDEVTAIHPGLSWVH